jgi:hypothetical protein
VQLLFKEHILKKTTIQNLVAKVILFIEETDETGNEIISIMFEMKNEGDETSDQKKERRFFKRT